MREELNRLRGEILVGALSTRRVALVLMLVLVVLPPLLPAAHGLLSVSPNSVVSLQAGEVWTDKQEYGLGETVTITMSYTQMIGVKFWVGVYKPDKSNFELDFDMNANSVTTTADQEGDWGAALWSQVVVPDSTAELKGSCTFTVIKGGGETVQVTLASVTAEGLKNVGEIIFLGTRYYRLPAYVSVTPNQWYRISAVPPDNYEFDHWEGGYGVRGIKDPYADSTEVFVQDAGYVNAWFKPYVPPAPNTKIWGRVESGTLWSRTLGGSVTVTVIKILDGLDAKGQVKLYDTVTVSDLRGNGRCTESNRAQIDDVTYTPTYHTIIEVYGDGGGGEVLVDCAPKYVRNLSAQDLVFSGEILYAAGWDLVIKIANVEQASDPYHLLTMGELVFVDASPCYEHHTCQVDMPFSIGDKVDVRGKFHELQNGYGDVSQMMLYIFVHESQHYAKSQKYTITVNTSPSGLDDPQGGGSYAPNKQITISVSDVDDYSFQKWQRDSIDYSTQMSFQYTVDASHTFTAIFQSNQPSQCVNSVDDPSKLTCISYLRYRAGLNPDNPDITGKQVTVRLLIHSRFDTSETGLPPEIKILEIVSELTNAGGGLDLFLKAAELVNNGALFYVAIGYLPGEGTACSVRSECPPDFLIAGSPPPPSFEPGSVVEIHGKIRHSNTMNYLEVSGSKVIQPAADFVSLADLVDSCTIQDKVAYCSQPQASKIGQKVTVIGQVWERDLVNGNGRIRIRAADMFLTKRSVWLQVPSSEVPPNMGAIIVAHGQVTSDFVDADETVVIAPQDARSPINGHESLTTMVALVHSPVALNVYDSQGRHTGPVLDSQGNLIRVDSNIPNSRYSGFGTDQQMVVVINAVDTYEVRVVGLADGSFSLVAATVGGGVTQYIADVTNQPITKHQEVSFGRGNKPQQCAITFYADPASGTISTDGTLLSNGSTMTYTIGVRVHVVADAPVGYVFSNWAVSGVSVDNTVTPDTYMTVSSSGSLRAVFTPTPPPPSPPNPLSSYLPGLIVIVLAVAAVVAVVYRQRGLKTSKRTSVPHIVSVESSRPRIVGVETSSRPRIIDVRDYKGEE